MDIAGLAVQLISGAVGGNAAGAVMQKFSLGTLGNSIVGILGGGIGGQVLAMLGVSGAESAAGGMDIGSILTQVAAGGVGGGGLLAIIGVVKSMLGK